MKVDLFLPMGSFCDLKLGLLAMRISAFWWSLISTGCAVQSLQDPHVHN